MYRRILVAIDGSNTSNKALAAAVEMAGYSGGRSVIRLIHVLDEMAYFTGLDPYAGQTYSAVHAMRQAGEKILAEGLTPAVLQLRSIEATEKLSLSKNSKLVILGNNQNTPLILPVDREASRDVAPAQP